MCVQLQKLGIIPFDEHLSGPLLTTYKLMWANNGDCISRQYTGTAAMKVGSIHSVATTTEEEVHKLFCFLTG